jgi:hypothetical protein
MEGECRNGAVTAGVPPPAAIAMDGGLRSAARRRSLALREIPFLFLPVPWVSTEAKKKDG